MGNRLRSLTLLNETRQKGKGMDQTAQSPERHVILGAGGHARVLCDLLRSAGKTVVAFSDSSPSRAGTVICGLPVIAEADLAATFSPGAVLLVNGVGGVRDMSARQAIFEQFQQRGYRFATLVHPTAFVAHDTVLEEGAQVLAGAMVITGAMVGKNTILNTRASVDHDCHIGAHCHIAPGVTLSGGVRVGDATLIGTGASVIQGIRIGTRCIVGAGAAVVRHIADGVMAVGVPARQCR